MAVVIETTLGDMTVDLFIKERPRACLNFLKLCKMKYYNFNLFHNIEYGFIAQTGDPTGEGTGGCSIWGVLEGPSRSYFEAEKMPKLKHTEPGIVSMVTSESGMIGSQFFITLGPDLDSLDSRHCIIGQVTEGHEIIRLLNETICDTDHRPYRDVRITHTVILEDPFDDPRRLREPSRSPSPSKERMVGGRIGPDEEIDDFKGKSEEEIAEMIQEREAKARATILEIVGDLPDADIAPPENVLFVCKLNPVTSDDDLEIIFSRFGKINCCEIIRDKKTGDSLQYAFIEFEDKKSCEDAYFKMDNVLIDDRRIHVDFSQSVSKIKWRGRGKGAIVLNNENPNDYQNNRERREPPKKQERRSRDREYKEERNGRKFKEPSTERHRGRFEQNRPFNKYPDRRSPRRDRSPKRDRSPRRERSPRRDRSPKRGRSPRRDRSPKRNRSPRRDRSPKRNTPPRRDRSPIKDKRSERRRERSYDSDEHRSKKHKHKSRR